MDCRVSEIVERQRAFFASGATRPLEFRREALRKLRRALMERENEIAEALRKDLHKSPFESYLTETGLVLAEIDLHLRCLKGWMRPRRVATPFFLQPATSRTQYEPLGVALIISPWNYPLQLTLNPLVGAISAGCCAVLKPSPSAPHTAAVMHGMIRELFDESYIAVVEDAPGVMDQLLDTAFDILFYTGGGEFGRTVMTAAARNLTPVVLELGGKSPCIVGAEANLEVAARRIVWGKLLNAGQTCVAPDYLLVHESVAEPLLEEMKRAVVRFFGDDPSKSDDYPRMISVRAAERMEQLLGTASRILWGGEVRSAEKYVAPSFVEAPEESPLWQEEIFGPLLPVRTFVRLESAIAFVNDRPKPLALYYFGSRRESRNVLVATSSGGFCLNDTIMHLANNRLPFGGVGYSGMGRYHGRESFLAFSNCRAVLCNSTRFDLPVRYAPYKGFKWVKKIF